MIAKVFSTMKPEDFKAPKRGVKRVFLHCSASDNPLHDNPNTIESWHLQRGFKQIGYHFYINQRGDISQCRDLETIPAAQEGHNLGTIAICCGGLHDFSVAQMQVLKKLCLKINEAYGGQVTFHGHKEVNPNKTCPVYSYQKLLNLNKKGNIE